MGADLISESIAGPSASAPADLRGAGAKRPAINWANSSTVAIVHLLLAGVLWVGWSPIAIAAALLSFMVRGFGITAFYHRYFSHRAFKTSRAAQFIFALIGNSALQGAMIDWVAIHRLHHRKTDEPADVHSPVAHGFWWSHVGWVGCQLPAELDRTTVADLRKFPELLVLERLHAVAPLLFAAVLLGAGSVLARHAPALHTNGPQLLVWGMVISTVALWHATWSVNSICHMFGRRRFNTGDDSRNNGLIAAVALGEGWHNNHHRYPGSARQGFYPSEIDITYYGLLLLQQVGLIWGLRPVPAAILDAGRQTGRNN